MDKIQQVEEVGGDIVLQVFAKMAQEGNLTISVTLSVGGAIVTGEVIGRDRWLQEFDRATTSVGSTLGEGLRLGFEAGDLDQAGGDVHYEYLHLMNAAYLAGERYPTGSGVLWRGRIPAIDGWSLGSLK